MRKLLLTIAAIVSFTAATLAQNVPAYVPTNGLAGWWPFNGNANDESGNGNNGTVNGATLTNDRFGSSGKAYNFDGVSSYIAMPQITNQNINEFSISMWYFNPTPPGNLCFTYYHGASTGEWGLSDSAMIVKLANDTWYSVPFNRIYSNWTNIVGVYSRGNNIKVYINGQYVSETAIPNQNLWTTNTLSSVGAYARNQYFNPCSWKGKIDDIGIWNRALTQQEITALYAGSICTPTSSTFTVAACNSYFWAAKNKTYTVSNTTDTIKRINKAGCDSIVTLNLTMRKSTSSTFTVSACNSYFWAAKNKTYTASNNIDTVKLINKAGCDSIVTLNLTIGQSTSGTFTVSACNSYFWAAKNKTYTASNNTDTVRLVNKAGCDSIVTLNLTINTALPGTPGTMTGASDVCPAFSSPTAAVSSNITYSIPPMSTASSYTWTVPTGVTLVSGQGTNSIVVNFAATFVSGAISVKASNACGSSAAARTLTVYRRTAATPAVIQKEFAPVSVPAVTNVCGVTSEIYRIRKVIYATSYNWSLSQGSKATITRLNSPGVNDTAIRVTFAAGFTRDTLRVTAQTSPCAVSSVRILALSATLTPPAPTAITTQVGNFTVCVGNVNSYTALTTTPTTTQSAVQNFRWTRPLNTTITSATADSATITLRIDAGFTGGSLSVVTVSACGISSAAKSAPLQYLPATPSGISASTGSLNACIGNTITYAAIVSPPAASQAPSAQFRWSRPANTTIISAAADSSTITLQFNSGYIGGVLSVRGQSSCGTLGSARTVTLTRTGCPSGSRISDITGAKNNPATSWDIQLLPNPTSGSFTLQSNRLSDMPRVVMVRDMQGRLMQSFRMLNPVRSSFGSDLPSGTYMIEVWQGVEKKTIKGVKI